MANANGRRTNPNIEHGSAAPTTGTYAAGDIVINYNPVSTTGDIGWVCVAAGTPGTWISFGSITDAAQTIAGAKTFSGDIVGSATITATNGLTVGSSAATIGSTGNIVTAGSVRGLRAVTKQATNGTVAPAPLTSDSGRVYANTATSGTTTWVLPSAAAGLTYTFVEAGDAGGMIKITAASGDKIIGKTDGASGGTGIATSGGGSIENSSGTNVRGDFVTLVAIDDELWHMVAIAGVWAVSA